MKKLMILVAFVLLTVSAVAGEKINLRRTGYDEVMHPGCETPVFISIANIDDRKLDRVNVRIDSPDIDILGYARAADISAGHSVSYVIPLDIPLNTPPGDYYFRITVSNDDVERQYYRILSVQ